MDVWFDWFPRLLCIWSSALAYGVATHISLSAIKKNQEKRTKLAALVLVGQEVEAAKKGVRARRTEGGVEVSRNLKWLYPHKQQPQLQQQQLQRHSPLRKQKRNRRLLFRVSFWIGLISSWKDSPVVLLSFAPRQTIQSPGRITPPRVGLINPGISQTITTS